MSNPLKNLVVLGSRVDPHVARVADRIAARSDIAVHILDYLDVTRFALAMNIDGDFTLSINGRKLSEYLIWDRTKLIPGSRLYVQGEAEAREFAANEWLAMYKLMSGLGEDKVVNSLASKMCQIKPFQQRMAARCGFKVPPSIVSNDKRSLAEFSSVETQPVIMKSLSATNVKSDGDGSFYYVMTMRLGRHDIDGGSEEEFAFCPHFVQHEVIKDYELRVIVIGKAMLAFHIDSQKSRLTELDWRNGQELINFALVDLDDRVSAMLRCYMAASGLFSGSFDLIVDRGGDVWFLECNQDGAWGWLDNGVHGQVADTFAEQLMLRMGYERSKEAALNESGSALV